MTVYREHFTDENELPTGPEGWIYAGTDDEFGILDRWMVPITEELYRDADGATPEICPGYKDGRHRPTEGECIGCFGQWRFVTRLEEGGSESQPPEKGTPPTP